MRRLLYRKTASLNGQGIIKPKINNGKIYFGGKVRRRRRHRRRSQKGKGLPEIASTLADKIMLCVSVKLLKGLLYQMVERSLQDMKEFLGQNYQPTFEYTEPTEVIELGVGIKEVKELFPL